MNRLGWNRVFGGGGSKRLETPDLGVVGVIALGLGIFCIPAVIIGAVLDSEEKKAMKELKEKTETEVVYILSEKEVEEIEHINGVDNYIFNVDDKTLTILANVDTKTEEDVTFAYEFNMTENLFNYFMEYKDKEDIANWTVESRTLPSFNYTYVMDEVVESSKGELTLTYECSEEDVERLNEVIAYSKHNPRPTKQNSSSKR